MGIIGPILLVLIACFGFVLAFGPPYLPTLTKHMNYALELAELQPGQTLLELGCGDGKVLLAAARQGATAVGFELNPLLVIFCKLRCWRYRKLVRIHWANMWSRPWPPSDVIFVFTLEKYMAKVDTRILNEVAKPVRLISFAFKIPGKRPTRKKGGAYCYDYATVAKA